ncbi:MAG: class I SAM-dependent methyltransferase [Planctomycetes bacterium]|nr:class I SAM-dependent methyltransferase [Planctomycetota bacterium]
MLHDYRESHLSPEKGESYHRQFEENPHRSMIWEFEKRILDRILLEFLDNCEIRHFDFACGTGRILAHYEKRAHESVGVDISSSMLETARRNLDYSKLIQADITREDVLDSQKFNLITAFRFFPNAQPKLRSEAMQALVRHLDKDGYMVFNNHRNLSSSRCRIARLCGRGGREGMAMAEVKDLVLEHSMKIVRVYHLCVLPASERRMLLPYSILRSMERVLSRFRLFRNLGENLIFVCKHAGNESL